MITFLNLIIGGAAGTVARYGLALAVNRACGAQFPFGTLAVNLSGCFLVGIFASLAEEKFLLGTNARMLLMIGFCGAFTTFSTFILETSYLIRDGETFRAFMNVMVSVAAGFILFRIGMWLGKVM
ncbi:MAG TPA: fluoride efflux transporter CrcB [Candidatus Omnitrophota bacterium]|nr:fluoride efflux transporter CrcB [Candidatus Omnitrophota bacterium]HPT06764.1 fluoride efflux transporter CrcB [Candidatus Omnitrophota bacterium]